MRRLFNLDGSLFGYEMNKYLYHYSGKCVGKFELGLIYANDGSYLGEITAFGILGRHKFKINQSTKPWNQLDGQPISYTTQEISQRQLSQSFYELFPKIEEIQTN